MKNNKHSEKMNLTIDEVARMIDISAVKAESNIKEVELIVKEAKKYNFICIFVLPSFIPLAKELLEEEQGINIGGVVGFPSGGSTTSSKAFEAEELINMGCNEIDMVINIGKLKSNLYHDVSKDTKKIVEVSGAIPVKVILEVSLLTDSEIQNGSKIIQDSGAQFIKTGTGWAGKSTFRHIQLIKKAVGESIKVKVAGGVHSLDILLKMYEMGVCRFGIGHKVAIKIMNEFSNDKI